MIDAALSYRRYAAILMGALLVYVAFTRRKPGDKWYWRAIFGAIGIVLLYVNVHLLVKSR